MEDATAPAAPFPAPPPPAPATTAPKATTAPTTKPPAAPQTGPAGPPAGSEDRAFEFHQKKELYRVATPEQNFKLERNCAACAVQCLVRAASTTSEAHYKTLVRDLTKDWKKNTSTPLGQLVGVLGNQNLPTARVVLMTKKHALAFIAGMKPEKRKRPTETGNAWVLEVNDDYTHIECIQEKVEFTTPLPLVDISEVISRLRAGGEPTTTWALQSSTPSSTSTRDSTPSSSTSSSDDSDSNSTSDSESDSSDPDFVPTRKAWSRIESACKSSFNVQFSDEEGGGTKEDISKALSILEAMQQTVGFKIYSTCKSS